ncbi:MAG: phage replication initiation protein, NGO0469 family [Hominilimicola sp.]
MEFIVKANEGSTIEPLDEGLYTGICTKLIDLGWQYSEKYDKKQHKMMLGWDIAGEKVELATGEKVNRTMWKEYSTSLGDKSTLRKDLQSWRGKAFTIQELAGFNLYQILGVPCQMQIIHTEKNGNKYANISAIIAMPKGMPKPEGDYNTTFFNMDCTDTFGEFGSLPTWIQDKIKNSENYESSGLKAFIESPNGYSGDDSDGYSDIDCDDDDLPF